MKTGSHFGIPGSQPFRTDVSEARRVLREAIEQQRVGVDGLHAARFQLVKLFALIERMQERIDEAFAGEPFLPNLAPDAPANTRRFNAYFGRHKQTTKLLSRALDLWILTCGMKLEDDWVPLLIEQMRQRQAVQDAEGIANSSSKARGSTARPKTIPFPGG